MVKKEEDITVICRDFKSKILNNVDIEKSNPHEGEMRVYKGYPRKAILYKQ